MKPSSKQSLGNTLIILSVLTLLIAICQITPVLFVTVTCKQEQDRQQEVGVDTRISYCISVWSRQAINGSGVYAAGTTRQDEITVRELNLRRDGQTLSVNNHPLNIGEVYKTTHWTPSINPWLIFTSRFAIKNEGLPSPESSAPANVLYVSGDVYEGWFPNPFGLIILGGGIWLSIQGKKERKQVI